MTGRRATASALPWRLRPLAVTLALVTLGAITPTSAVGAAAVTDHSKDLAKEVCENMVRDPAVAAAGQPLTRPQTGTWNGRRYTCRYEFAGGELRLSVDAMSSTLAAKTRFAAARRRAVGPTRLYGIGEQGFQRRDRTVVARKDNFVLTVDPTRLPARLNRDAIAWSSTRAIFDCW